MQVTDLKFNFSATNFSFVFTFFAAASGKSFFSSRSSRFHSFDLRSRRSKKLIAFEMFADVRNCSGGEEKSFSLVECRLSPIHHVCGSCKYLRFADKKMFYLRNAKHDTFALKIL